MSTFSARASASNPWLTGSVFGGWHGTLSTTITLSTISLSGVTAAHCPQCPPASQQMLGVLVLRPRSCWRNSAPRNRVAQPSQPQPPASLTSTTTTTTSNNNDYNVPPRTTTTTTTAATIRGQVLGLTTRRLAHMHVLEGHQEVPTSRY